MSIIVALDVDSLSSALALSDRLNPQQCRLKVGKELFTAVGPQVVQQLHARGFEIFLDLKFHDIPNTAAQAVLAAAELGVWMVNVHASGGEQMMTTCAQRLDAGGYQTQLIAVTVLTSMNMHDLQGIGIQSEVKAQVDLLARLAQQCGLDGVVCSAQEASSLRQQLGRDFVLVTPGIRPDWAALDDQKRTLTPTQAIQSGANHIVIGRPITQSKDPAKALQSIFESIAV